MDRRQFFRRALRKTGETLVNQAESQLNSRAAHWIRPPFALDELEFLLACTRCNVCIVEPKAINIASLHHSEAGQETRCDHVS
ncbi:MAG: hypothetical protein OEN52_08940 [Gammaproteobacteria bacterium]|nr:hypothetical protein [Gammaproteobacteria bacterium]MDH3561060.1 hypothetical protein [Gammaproteobacteria bacterium]